MCYFTSDYSKHSHDNSVTYVRTSWMDAIEMITITEDLNYFRLVAVQLRRCRMGFGFTFFLFL